MPASAWGERRIPRLTRAPASEATATAPGGCLLCSKERTGPASSPGSGLGRKEVSLQRAPALGTLPFFFCQPHPASRWLSKGPGKLSLEGLHLLRPQAREERLSRGTKLHIVWWEHFFPKIPLPEPWKTLSNLGLPLLEYMERGKNYFTLFNVISDVTECLVQKEEGKLTNQN